ncbi:hypothetical protein DUNSADRAFT_14441 [Dunaliella salina]|uniref:RNase III domain-containing protein n=1 Tax=Dunaliella salina TaxID=3046 RepID=A0ABQ7H9N2_DUNSA|nr:hypothetical protein DUNSADRAFT_14441 [Dunaliella salina]|eukprot:KAF5843525.1 hypothetical protein DUNSADRAFT_14441 [Dunaliella salina]
MAQLFQGALKQMIHPGSVKLKIFRPPHCFKHTTSCKPRTWGNVSRQGLEGQAQQTQQQRLLKDIKSRYTASALAFLGDAVWSMHVRRHYLLPPKHSTKYHDAVDKHSAAEMQALYYDQLIGSSVALESSSHCSDPTAVHKVSSFASFALSASEDAVIQWTLSEPFLYRQRFQGKEGAQVAYQKATALEALVGYLALTDEARLGQLMATLLTFLPEQ